MLENNQQTASTIVNIDHIKQINNATIYKVIEKNAPISRVEISKISKLAPASVTKITRQLLNDGIITETSKQTSNGGRRAISLTLNDSSIHVLAINIGHKTLSLSCYNLLGKEVSKKQVDTTLLDGEQLIDLLLSEISLIVNNKNKSAIKISAIAITLAGLINPKKGIIIYASRYLFDNFPLISTIEQEFNIPTFIGNHTRGLALAEHYFGASKDCLDSILINIHHGVGSGIIIQGKCLLGENYNIGEIGHIQINSAGKKCHCGNFGCLETELNNAAIIKKVQIALNYGETSVVNSQTLTVEEIYQAAANNDPLCKKIVEDAATYLGKAVAILVNLLNPEKIIINGKITKSEDVLFSTIQQCVAHHSLHEFQKKLKIVPAKLESNSTLSAFVLIKQAIYDGNLLQKIHA